MKKKIFALAAAMVIGLMSAGCGAGQGTAQENTQENTQEDIKTFIDVTDDGLVANFDKSEEGIGGSSGITIGDGEYLVVDSGLSEGKVRVTVTSGGSDINKVPTEDTSTMPTIDHECEGVGETEYGMIAPGDYMVNVSVTEKASGKINFIIKSDETSAETKTQ